MCISVYYLGGNSSELHHYVLNKVGISSQIVPEDASFAFGNTSMVVTIQVAGAALIVPQSTMMSYGAVAVFIVMVLVKSGEGQALMK